MSQDANICRFTVLFSQNVETTIAGAKEFLKERRPRKKATEQEEKKARHYDDDERVITEIGRELDVEMVARSTEILAWARYPVFRVAGESREL